MADFAQRDIDDDERRYWITPEQYKALSRPLTDPPLGGSVGSQHRRRVCAELSDLVTERVGFTPRKNSKQGEKK